jgi:drug/metabolite transporter (DMT)-like permease
MDSIALALVIAGALAHASWNLLAKRASGGPPFVWLYGMVSLLATAPFAVWLWPVGTQGLDGLTWGVIVLSAVTHLAHSLALQKGYQAGDFSVVYPLARGTGPLFAVLAATVLLHELPTPLGWVGIAAIVVGIFLISDLTSGLSGRSDRVRAGVRWGFVNGACIAAYTLVDAWAIRHLGLAAVVYYVLGLGFRMAFLAPMALSQGAALRRQWRLHARHVVAVGVLAPVAYNLFLLAMARAPLVYIAPARELSMLVAVALGTRLLDEPFAPRRMLGTGLMLAGVVLLAVAG